jgi:hypothetical protein
MRRLVLNRVVDDFEDIKSGFRLGLHANDSRHCVAQSALSVVAGTYLNVQEIQLVVIDERLLGAALQQVDFGVLHRL